VHGLRCRLTLRFSGGPRSDQRVPTQKWTPCG
jgi:hypothetical protein